MSLRGGSRIGCLQDISSRNGCHACVCQVGVIITIANCDDHSSFDFISAVHI